MGTEFSAFVAGIALVSAMHALECGDRRWAAVLAAVFALNVYVAVAYA